MTQNSSAASQSKIIQMIAGELKVGDHQVAAAVALLNEGATVPFIARYRKEVTGDLDDTQLRNLEERLVYLRELEDRRRTILASIEEQGKLTDELSAAVDGAATNKRWKIFICRSNPGAAPRRRSPAKPGLNL